MNDQISCKLVLVPRPTLFISSVELGMSRYKHFKKDTRMEDRIEV